MIVLFYDDEAGCVHAAADDVEALAVAMGDTCQLVKADTMTHYHGFVERFQVGAVPTVTLFMDGAEVYRNAWCGEYTGLTEEISSAISSATS